MSVFIILIKVANLDSLSIYMNTKTQLFTRFDTREFPKLFLERIATKDHTPENFNYGIYLNPLLMYLSFIVWFYSVLAPISSMAKLQLNMNPEYDSPPFVIPKIDLGLDVDRLNLGLGKSQYQVYLGNFFQICISTQVIFCFERIFWNWEIHSIGCS